ncbi:MAG: hypothetical protein ABF289_17940 [Clostridiales bacterium]
MVKKYFVFKMGIIVCIFCLMTSFLSLTSYAADTQEIISLTASKTEITRGDSVILEWEVTGAERISIEGPEKLPDIIFPLSSSYELFPLETTTYTLVAYSDDDTSIRKSITVKVTDNLESVAIDSFSASEYSISPDTDVELTWVVRNEKDIEMIDSDGNNVEISNKESTVIVSPDKTITYTLTATANDEIEKATITINVVKSEGIAEVKINKFFADRTLVPKGSVVYLNWSVDNAEKVTLDYLTDNWYSEVDSSGSKMVIIYETRTFELNTTDVKGNTLTTSITIDVEAEEDMDQASISEFESTSYSVEAEETFSLNWGINNAVESTLTDSDNNITELSSLESGKIDLTIEDTTIYTLTAVGKNGLKVTAKIIVEVKDPSETNIKKFYASSYNVTVGELVKLTWDVENVSSSFISTSDGYILEDIDTSGSVYVTPNKTTTYKLIAYSVGQEVKISEITIEVSK